MTKTILLQFMLFVICFLTSAQTKVEFAYDLDGNITKRYVVYIRNGVKAIDPPLIAQASDETGGQKVVIYPNPTKGVFQIGISPFDEKKKCNAILYSVSGVRLIEAQISGEITDMDISGYSSGIYLLNITIGAKVSKWKVIKE